MAAKSLPGEPLGRSGLSESAGRYRPLLGPILLAVVLYALNNLAMLSGWLNPPGGHKPTLMLRAWDIAQYLTWARASEKRLLLPNYHAPWQTEPALTYPLMWVLSRACRLMRIELAAGYHVFHFVLYLLAAYSLFFCFRVFTDTRKQAVAAFFTILGSVPITALAILPGFVLTFGRWNRLPGLGDFIWWSSDGFFHGIDGAVGATFGTATTLLAFAYLARYLKTEQKRYLAYASTTTFVSAFFHPFEVFVIAGAGAGTILWRSGRQWPRALLETALLGVSGAAGLSHYVVLSLRHQWLRDSVDLARWDPGSPLKVLVMLGLPTVLALVFLVMQPKMASKTDLLLQAWVVCTLVFLYIPWIPHSQHLLDGFHYAVGLLLVRQVSQSAAAGRILKRYPHLVLRACSACCLLSIAPYVVFYRQSFRDGQAAQPARLYTTVAPNDELAAVAWLRQNARDDQLVLGPPDSAPWLATVPMHSFASHYLFSLTYPEQARHATDFYEGKLNSTAARQLLTGYVVRYVVVPERSPAIAYLEQEATTVRLGSLLVYEFPGNSMKPYSRPRN